MPSDPDSAGEEAVIARYWAPLAAGYSGALSLKDDCALIAPPPATELVVTTDGVIAGVHFLPGEDPGAVAWKALAVNVSDLIAKGAAPVAYLMSIALPGAPDHAWLEKFAAGLHDAQQAFGCHLAGGDTDRTPGPLSVTITAIGGVPTGGMVRRSTARVGDYVYVSGTIGDATLGLALRRNPEMRAACRLSPEMSGVLEGKFSRPKPPIALIAALRSCASAAMDISDGLIKDFDRLCRASGVGGRIDVPRVPLSAAARAAVAAGGATLVDLITGGEDYEVLATVAPPRAAEYERLAAAAGVAVTRIGVIDEVSAGTSAIDATGAPLAIARTGWDHFDAP
ncbi:MAG: thiamine-phosphate kinase [Hyphomicrobium sp.]|jgi:thiamine-monophosphate kinase